eukprot:GHRQ01034569.1.p2 GENE.GHRQ01034569.1~~GHRQ01034569.1.p2  ORF type:complete len:127 (-),score=25.23 GHRQ01034569.1:228-608(-)
MFLVGHSVGVIQLASRATRRQCRSCSRHHHTCSFAHLLLDALLAASGCEDGSCWSSRPWRWNPVQGGSWHNAPPKLLARSAFGDMISTSVLPRNWGGQDLLEDVVMTTQTLLLPNMVKVRLVSADL